MLVTRRFFAMAMLLAAATAIAADRAPYPA
jgi:hypothetical protein